MNGSETHAHTHTTLPYTDRHTDIRVLTNENLPRGKNKKISFLSLHIQTESKGPSTIGQNESKNIHTKKWCKIEQDYMMEQQPAPVLPSSEVQAPSSCIFLNFCNTSLIVGLSSGFAAQHC